MLRITSEIYDLCVEKRYFTSGSNEQYQQMFNMAEDEAFSDRDVAIVIWICSSNADLATVEKEIAEIRKEND